MDVRYFNFDSLEKLSEAKRYLEKSYPYLVVLDNINTLNLAVESKNSLILDSRINSIMYEHGGSLIV